MYRSVWEILSSSEYFISLWFDVRQREIPRRELNTENFKMQSSLTQTKTRLPFVRFENSCDNEWSTQERKKNKIKTKQIQLRIWLINKTCASTTIRNSISFYLAFSFCVCVVSRFFLVFSIEIYFGCERTKDSQRVSMKNTVCRIWWRETLFIRYSPVLFKLFGMVAVGDRDWKSESASERVCDCGTLINALSECFRPLSINKARSQEKRTISSDWWKKNRKFMKKTIRRKSGSSCTFYAFFCCMKKHFIQRRYKFFRGYRLPSSPDFFPPPSLSGMRVYVCIRYLFIVLCVCF